LNASANVDGTFTYDPPAGTALPPPPSSVTVTATFTPKDGLSYETTTAVARITNTFDWTGFFSPVDNGSVNKVKAGSSIPIKFSLGGDKGLNIFAAGFPISVTASSFAGVVSVNDITDLSTAAAGNGLSYDPRTNQYTYVWKTDNGWAKTNRQLQIKLTDGTVHTANFTFSK
jgi:hypothetical protein